MRDTHRSKEYFETELESRQSYYKKPEEYLAFYNDENRFPPGPNGFRKLAALTTNFTEGFTCDIALKYCLGEELLDIHSARIEEALNRYGVLVDELAKGHPDEYVFWINQEAFDKTPYVYHSIYTWLAWFICFDGSADKISKISPYLCAAGTDRLVDTVLQRYQPDRKLADSAATPKTFGLLEHIIDASPAQRITLIEQYLENWPIYMGHFDGLKSIGINGTSDVKSREDLINNAVMDIDTEYYGLWAWEVALVVKFFNIDDTSFQDNEFYPKDLAHFALTTAT